MSNIFFVDIDYLNMPSNIMIWDVRWTLPDNEDKPEYEERFRSLLKRETKAWVFQLERGHTAQKLHFQCRVSLNNPASSELAVKRRWKVADDPAWHFSITSTSNTKNFEYQMKEDTRVRGPYTDKDPGERYIPRQWRIEYNSLYPWQQFVVDSLEAPDQRSVNILFDKSGNSGKSTVAHIARLRFSCYMLRNRGKGEDMLQDMYCQLQAKKDRQPSGIMVDLTRSSDQKHLKNVYDAIEDIKNGWVTDWRYGFKEWDFDSPVVWVMCNSLPNPCWMSMDRWRFWTIDANLEIASMSLGKAIVEYKRQATIDREEAKDANP